MLLAELRVVAPEVAAAVGGEEGAGILVLLAVAEAAQNTRATRLSQGSWQKVSGSGMPISSEASGP